MGWKVWGSSVGWGNIFPKRPDRLVSKSYRGFCLWEAKPPELEVDHLSPVSAEAKNVWKFTDYFPHMHPWRE